jgi:O-antigen ligase
MQFYYNKISKYLLFINIIALFTLPQLNNVHYDPSPSFWAQITFAWLSISLFLITCSSQKKISIPSITVPLALFGIYICIQTLFVHITFIGLSYTTALEMLICIFLAISVSTFTYNYSISTFVKYLSIGLVIGAIIQSAIGFIQYNNLFKYFYGIIFYDPTHPNTNIFGHFGQRNHYCHYLSWGTFALIYLFNVKAINKYIFVPLLCWFMFSITISASRSAFIYFAVAIIITLFYLFTHKDNPSKNLFILMLSASILLVIFEYLYPVMQTMIHHQQVASGLARLSSEGGETGRRLIEWKKAIITFQQSPIWGSGLFGYARQSVYLHHLFPNAELNSGLFTNCHNLILQLLAETGIIGTAIVFTGLLYNLKRILSNISVESIILLCMASTTISHSMLEYPIWYLYFLGPLVIFLSVDKPLKIFNNWIIWVTSIIPVIALIYIIVVNSIIFNRLVDYLDTPDDLETFQSQTKYLENLTENNVIASYLAIFTLDSYINIDTKFTQKTFTTEEQLKYVKKLTDFQPYPDDMIKLAKLEWNLGNKEQAESLIKVATNAYPVYKAGFLNTLHVKKYKVLYNDVNDKKSIKK